MSADIYNRPMTDRAKSVGSVLFKQSVIGGTSAMAKSNTSKISKISRTELKLLEKSSDRPLAGAMYFIAYTVLYSLCFLCAKYLYDRNHDLNPFQMLVMRSSFAITMQIALVNKELKKAVWDGVDRASVGPLIFRSF